MRSACSSILLCFRYAQGDLATIRHRHECALFFRCGEPRKDVAKCNAETPLISRIKSTGTIGRGLQGIPIRADGELGTPLFGYNLRKPGHACFRCAVVDLTTARSTVSENNFYELSTPVHEHSRIPIHSTCATDVNNVPRLSIFYSEIWRCSPH